MWAWARAASPPARATPCTRSWPSWPPRNIDAHVTTVGCIGQCVKEPLVDIEQAGQPRITYANVKPDMVPRLIEEHLINNRPVEEWVVGRLETN